MICICFFFLVVKFNLLCFGSGSLNFDVNFFFGRGFDFFFRMCNDGGRCFVGVGFVVRGFVY